VAVRGRGLLQGEDVAVRGRGLLHG
jgi:hypothetical protein